VAYLARCFSDCGLIVALNQYGTRTFDLTLKGHVESYADLNIGVNQLDNPNLWGVAGNAEFGPWYWPSLPEALHSWRRKVDDVRESIDKPILKTLGFPLEVTMALSRSVVQFLGDNPEAVTFSSFAADSGNAYRRKDKPPDEDSVARVCAARISKWLERHVLPGQDVVVDAPHLASRFPSLLKGNPAKIASWNSLANRKKPAGIQEKLISDFRFQKSFWFSRPVWYWNMVAKCELIEEIKQPWGARKAPWVFCEDTSTFRERGDCAEFVADTESPFSRRYVKKLPATVVDYRPQVRFSM
jgi:hypothetical protein